MSEKTNIKNKTMMISSLALLIIVVGASLFLYGESYASSVFSIIGILIIVASYPLLNKAYRLNFKMKSMNIDFKTKLLTKLAKEVFGEAKYDPVYYVSEAEYLKSEFSTVGNNYTCSDTIISSINGIKFDVSDIEMINYVREKDYNENSVMFSGLFIRLYINSELKDKIKISEKNNLKVNNKGYQKLELESIDFNNKFNIYSTNPEAAFYLANPKYIEKLLDLESKVHGDFYLLYKDGLIYLLIDHIGISFRLKDTEELSPKLETEFRKYLIELKEILNTITK